jgi:ferredoxin
MAKKTLPQINKDRCTGCGRCVAACQPNILWLITENPNAMGSKHAQLKDNEKCTGCAQCVLVCPFDAARMISVTDEAP